MTIPVYTSTVPLSPDGVRMLPSTSVVECWSGGSLPRPFSWSLAVDPHAIWFSCALPGGAVTLPDSSAGAFKEGLWDADVAELFILDAEGAYQEYNFSPTGAWWTMRHSSYRVRANDAISPRLSFIETTVESDGWLLVSSIDRRSVNAELSSRSKVHIAGYWYAPSPRFLSSRPVRGIEPDFHHPGCFEGIELREVPSVWGARR